MTTKTIARARNLENVRLMAPGTIVDFVSDEHKLIIELTVVNTMIILKLNMMYNVQKWLETQGY